MSFSSADCMHRALPSCLGRVRLKMRLRNTVEASSINWRKTYQAVIFRAYSRSAGVYDIPRLWKISGVASNRGLVRVQAGDAVPVTQATTTTRVWVMRFKGLTESATPTSLTAAYRCQVFQHRSLCTAAPQFARSEAVRATRFADQGLQDADADDRKTFRITERASLEFRA